MRPPHDKRGAAMDMESRTASVVTTVLLVIIFPICLVGEIAICVYGLTKGVGPFLLALFIGGPLIFFVGRILFTVLAMILAMPFEAAAEKRNRRANY